jgi:hypothetical protein
MILYIHMIWYDVMWYDIYIYIYIFTLTIFWIQKMTMEPTRRRRGAAPAAPGAGAVGAAGSAGAAAVPRWDGGADEGVALELIPWEFPLRKVEISWEYDDIWPRKMVISRDFYDI